MNQETNPHFFSNAELFGISFRMDAAVDSYEKSKPFVFKPSKKSKEVGNRHHRSPE